MDFTNRFVVHKIENVEAIVRENVLCVEMQYPSADASKINTIEVDMCSVRTADSVRIFFDFERNGYVVLQASIFEWVIGDTIQDEDWQEVAFIPAWARLKRPEKL